MITACVAKSRLFIGPTSNRKKIFLLGPFSSDRKPFHLALPSGSPMAALNLITTRKKLDVLQFDEYLYDRHLGSEIRC